MATAVSADTNLTEVLMLWSKPVTQNIRSLPAILFVNIVTLINHLCKNITKINKFVLVISGDVLKILLDDKIHDFPQVEVIYVYYDNESNLEQDKNDYQTKYPKIQFIYEKDVETQIAEKIIVDHAISSPKSIERETIYGVASTIEQRISAKRSNTNSRHSLESKRLSIMKTHDNSVKNISQIPCTYICPVCKLIFRDPYQLNCGHRCCESCINFTNKEIICITCSEVSTNENIRFDRGFSRDMQQQTISCSVCTWIDAESERQKSIYSPPFYSSPTGYKMCLRLYLNGDSDTRNTHMSLFLIIMRNDYDAILHWPFSYEVLFRLIDQSTLNNNQRNITASFRPDIRSNCFHRPLSAMNDGYGIKKFLSLVEFEQNRSLYIKDNTMFIETNINFLSERQVMSSILHECGSPNDEWHIDTISEDFMNIS
ncbi:unnamed protein product [Rotaria sp. Silwood2]|nr:unnamed protein product [Rotaria sp. Silwood2]